MKLLEMFPSFVREAVYEITADVERSIPGVSAGFLAASVHDNATNI